MKFIIRYQNQIYRIICDKENTNISNSYIIKSIDDMLYIINEIKDRIKLANENVSDYSINQNKWSIVRKWRAHNFLYALHIARNRTKDIDINNNIQWYTKIGYCLCYTPIFNERISKNIWRKLN